MSDAPKPLLQTRKEETETEATSESFSTVSAPPQIPARPTRWRNVSTEDGLSKRLLKLFLFIIFSPVILAALFFWWLLGSPKVFAGVSTLVMIAMYLSLSDAQEIQMLGRFMFQTFVFEVVCLTIFNGIIAVAVIQSSPYPSFVRRVLFTSISIIITVYIAVKWTMFIFGTAVLNNGGVWAVFILCLLFTWLQTIAEFFVPTSHAKFVQAELDLLGNIGLAIHVEDDKCANIGYLKITNPVGPSQKPALVMAHGFGAGRSFFVNNVETLSEHYDVYSIDWLGIGSSSRPGFVAKTTLEAESFFIESLERWRDSVGLDTINLLGHSLGGYLSACYALQHPNRVDHLILASPVGVPEPGDRFGKSRGKIATFIYRRVLWGSVTPQRLLRFSGPFGPMLLRWIVKFRWGDIKNLDCATLAKYAYHLNAAPACGEHALYALLSPGAYAQDPLIHRLPYLEMRTTFVYGQYDWMDRRCGETITHKLNTNGIRAEVYVVPEAGHQVFIENAPYFNELIISFQTRG